MKTLKDIGIEIGFQTKSKNYRKAFYDKYIRNLDYKIICEHYDLISIFNLKDKLDWSNISTYQKLSEGFLLEFDKFIDWNLYSLNKYLNYSLMDIFKNKLHWYDITKYRKLNHRFYRDDIITSKEIALNICVYQKLSRYNLLLLMNYLDDGCWRMICKFQKLSEDFIREFQNQVDWDYISQYQQLSPQFVMEFIDKVNVHHIKKYQYDINVPFQHNLKDLSKFEIIGDYLYAYKAITTNRHSILNFQYTYLNGTVHHCFSDKSKNGTSFGLNISTHYYASSYGSNLSILGEYKLVKVRTKISDITYISDDGIKLRTRRLEILEETPVYDLDYIKNN